MTLFLCLLRTHVNATPVKVDSLIIEYQPYKNVDNLTHSYILQDSILQIQTKHTNVPIKRITDKCVLDSFITYTRMFYTEQTAMIKRLGEESIDSEDYPRIVVSGYRNHKSVLDDCFFLFDVKYYADYSRFTQMIVRLSKEYERSKDEALKHVVYSKDINKHDRYGRKIGKWMTKYRHSIVEANYKSGKLHGVVKRYSYTGALQQLRHYRMGALIGPAYSLSGFGDMAVYKDIKKSEVTQAYLGCREGYVPVNYTADEINYYNFGWSEQEKYYNDSPDYLHFAAYSGDSIPQFKSYYNKPINKGMARARKFIDRVYNWYYTHKYYTHK